MVTGDGGLVTVTAEPFNAETPIGALEAPVTPTSLFFVRCNFAVPRLDGGCGSGGSSRGRRSYRWRSCRRCRGMRSRRRWSAPATAAA
jgi:hypothetical protein